MADEADYANALMETERELGVSRITQALNSAPINVSGRCEDCDNPVGEERLKAMPTAARCIYCQTAFERGVA
jgi:phage/conjugal plasmid C-4 type zinc finger TraR family protein